MYTISTLNIVYIKEIVIKQQKLKTKVAQTSKHGCLYIK